jgi:hypothetical protein
MTNYSLGTKFKLSSFFFNHTVYPLFAHTIQIKFHLSFKLMLMPLEDFKMVSEISSNLCSGVAGSNTKVLSTLEMVLFISNIANF